MTIKCPDKECKYKRSIDEPGEDVMRRYGVVEIRGVWDVVALLPCDFSTPQHPNSVTLQLLNSVFLPVNHSSQVIHIIGAGLAGCEAAWQAARSGCRVALYEMKPLHFSPAHTSPDLAELVCSNSFKSNDRANASGLLKEEMRCSGSLIVATADGHRIPAGNALAVDRMQFSRTITETLEQEQNITIIRKEMTEMPAEGVVIIATGPLTVGRICRAAQPAHRA